MPILIEILLWGYGTLFNSQTLWGRNYTYDSRQITGTACCYILSFLADQRKVITFANIERDQYCLFFNVLMKTYLLHWSNMRVSEWRDLQAFHTFRYYLFKVYSLRQSSFKTNMNTNRFLMIPDTALKKMIRFFIFSKWQPTWKWKKNIAW